MSDASRYEYRLLRCVGKLNMVAKPMTFVSLLWESRCSVLAKLMSCCEADCFLERYWEEAREEQNTQLPKFYTFSEVQGKQCRFSRVEWNQVYSRHAVQTVRVSDFSCHAPLSILDLTLEQRRKKGNNIFKGCI